MNREGSLSIRTYTLTQNTHAHAHHQIVLPLRGSMTISVEDRPYTVGVGHCLITQAWVEHSYAAPEQSCFLIADMDTLPGNAMGVPEPCVAIEADLLAFATYAEVQLLAGATSEMSGLLYQLFFQLIAQQDFKARLDERIARVLSHLGDDLSADHRIDSLAEIACLSPSQFKALFRKHTGFAVAEYLTRKRMEHAKTLLMHTDYPVAVVALEVGYEDASAFSRRFRRHFGQSPMQVARSG